MYLYVVLVVGLTQMTYDQKTYSLTTTVEILLGELCDDCTAHVIVASTLVLQGI